MDEHIDTILNIFEEMTSELEKHATTKEHKELIQSAKTCRAIFQNSKYVIFRLLMNLVVLRVAPSIEAIERGDVDAWEHLDLFGLEDDMKKMWLSLSDKPELRAGILEYFKALSTVSQKGMKSVPEPLPVELELTDDSCKYLHEMTEGVNVLTLVKAFQTKNPFSSLVVPKKKKRSHKRNV